MTGGQPFVQLPSAHVASWLAQMKPGPSNHALPPNTQHQQVPVKAGSFGSVPASRCWKLCFKRHLWESYRVQCITSSELLSLQNLWTPRPVGKRRGENAVVPEEMLGLLPSRMLTQRDRWCTHTSSEPVCSVTRPQDKSSVSQCHSVTVLTLFGWEHQQAPLLEAYQPAMCLGSALS